MGRKRKTCPGLPTHGEDLYYWRSIEGYEGLYMINRSGEVWNPRRGRPVAATKRVKQRPYLSVNLFKDGKLKHFLIHRLVAGAFIPNPENKETVNHINEIRDDNRVENLEWATATEQATHGTRIARILETKRKGSR